MLRVTAQALSIDQQILIDTYCVLVQGFSSEQEREQLSAVMELTQGETDNKHIMHRNIKQNKGEE